MLLNSLLPMEVMKLCFRDVTDRTAIPSGDTPENKALVRTVFACNRFCDGVDEVLKVSKRRIDCDITALATHLRGNAPVAFDFPTDVEKLTVLHDCVMGWCAQVNTLRSFMHAIAAHRVRRVEVGTQELIIDESGQLPPIHLTQTHCPVDDVDVLVHTFCGSDEGICFRDHLTNVLTVGIVNHAMRFHSLPLSDVLSTHPLPIPVYVDTSGDTSKASFQDGRLESLVDNDTGAVTVRQVDTDGAGKTVTLNLPLKRMKPRASTYFLQVERGNNALMDLQPALFAHDPNAPDILKVVFPSALKDVMSRAQQAVMEEACTGMTQKILSLSFPSYLTVQKPGSGVCAKRSKVKTQLDASDEQELRTTLDKLQGFTEIAKNGKPKKEKKKKEKEIQNGTSSPMSVVPLTPPGAVPEAVPPPTEQERMQNAIALEREEDAERAFRVPKGRQRPSNASQQRKKFLAKLLDIGPWASYLDGFIVDESGACDGDIGPFRLGEEVRYVRLLDCCVFLKRTDGEPSAFEFLEHIELIHRACCRDDVVFGRMLSVWLTAHTA